MEEFRVLYLIRHQSPAQFHTGAAGVLGYALFIQTSKRPKLLLGS